MELYIDPRTVNCRKVLAGFTLMGVDYETENVDFSSQGHKTPEYLAINPNGMLPALTDGDLKLWESNAILQYGADKAGASSAYPKDLKVRADINRWLLWEASAWFPSCYVYMMENFRKPRRDQQPDLAILEAEAPNFHNLAGILDARLAGQMWICGAPEPTIADIAVAAPLHLHRYAKQPLEEHSNICAWMDRIEALPCWISTDVTTLMGLR